MFVGTCEAKLGQHIKKKVQEMPLNDCTFLKHHGTFFEQTWYFLLKQLAFWSYTSFVNKPISYSWPCHFANYLHIHSISFSQSNCLKTPHTFDSPLLQRHAAVLLRWSHAKGPLLKAHRGRFHDGLLRRLRFSRSWDGLRLATAATVTDGHLGRFPLEVKKVHHPK